MHAIALGLALFGLWLLSSGHADLVGFGVGSCVFVTGLAWRMGIADEEALPLHLIHRLPRYIPWLIREIVLANIDVVRRIVRPHGEISPTLVEVQSTQKTALGTVILANSITLTPGTVSIRIRNGVILVHALTKQGADDLLSGEMDRRVTQLEGAS